MVTLFVACNVENASTFTTLTYLIYAYEKETHLPRSRYQFINHAYAKRDIS